MENVIDNVLDFIIIQLPHLFFDFYNIIFSPFIDILEDTFNLNVPELVSDALGNISLIGMFSIGFIVSVLLFKLIALIIPN